MKKRYIITLLLAFCMLFTLTGCKQKVNKISKNINKALKDVNEVVTDISVNDQNVLVYRYISTVSFITEDTASVSTNILTLDNNFQLQSQTTSDTRDNVSREELFVFKLKINKKICKDIVEEKDKVTFKVSNGNIKEVFDNQDMNALGDASFVFLFTKGKIVSMECTYQATSGRDVKITCTYQY